MSSTEKYDAINFDIEKVPDFYQMMKNLIHSVGKVVKIESVHFDMKEKEEGVLGRIEPYDRVDIDRVSSKCFIGLGHAIKKITNLEDKILFENPFLDVEKYVRNWKLHYLADDKEREHITEKCFGKDYHKKQKELKIIADKVNENYFKKSRKHLFK